MVSKTDNLTAVLYGINDLRLEQRPIPTPQDHEVLLQMEVVGICGSDVHYLTKGQCGTFVVRAPMVIGHEASATVVQVGKNVKNLKSGDRVAIEPGVGCRICTLCKQGKYNLCPEMKFCATPPIDGNLARYYTHAADYCYKLPDHVTLQEGALLEPLSVGVHACKRANVTVGSTVLILGAGPIGLVTLLSAKAFGASKIVITDLIDSQLKVAKEIGADYTILVDRKDTDEQLVQKVLQALGGEPSVSFDCTGVEQCVRVALQATAPGGVAVLVGIGKPDMNVPLATALIREVDIRGVFRYCNDYQTALDMVASGRINVNPLVTHHFTMEDSLKAFHTSKTGEGNAVKVLIHPNPTWKP